MKPVSIWLSSEYTRAAPGGTGAAKCGGNYAASLLAAGGGGRAAAATRSCFLDAVEHKWVEELGGMNLFFVYADGTIVTPELTGTILEGVTRASILELAADLGHKIEERRISIDEWRDGVASGEITEVFACGTAAVVTPVGRLVGQDGEVGDRATATGPVTAPDPPAPARHPVRPRRGHPRLDAPARLSGRRASTVVRRTRRVGQRPRGSPRGRREAYSTGPISELRRRRVTVRRQVRGLVMTS